MKSVLLGSLIAFMSLTSYAGENKDTLKPEGCCDTCAKNNPALDCNGGARTVVDKSPNNRAKSPSKKASRGSAQ